MKSIRIFAFAMLALFAVSCSSTQVVSSYKDQDATARNYKKILVLGIFQQKDRVIREQAEGQLADRLNKLGYTAVTSIQEFGPKSFDKVNEEEVASQLKNSGFDAVITTAVIDKQQSENYQPGRVDIRPVGVVYNRFGRYYSTVYDRVYQPGYYTKSTDFVVETNLYDIKDGNLVYSAQTQSMDPGSANDLAAANSKHVIRDMQAQGVLRGKS